MRLSFAIGGYLEPVTTPLRFVHHGYLYEEIDAPETVVKLPIVFPVSLEVYDIPIQKRKVDDGEILLLINAFMKTQTR